MEQRDEGRVQCCTLATKFVKVMCLAEGDVVKYKKALPALMARPMRVSELRWVLPSPRQPAGGLITP